MKSNRILATLLIALYYSTSCFAGYVTIFSPPKSYTKKMYNAFNTNIDFSMANSFIWYSIHSTWRTGVTIDFLIKSTEISSNFEWINERLFPFQSYGSTFDTWVNDYYLPLTYSGSLQAFLDDYFFEAGGNQYLSIEINWHGFYYTKWSEDN